MTERRFPAPWSAEQQFCRQEITQAFNEAVCSTSADVGQGCTIYKQRRLNAAHGHGTSLSCVGFPLERISHLVLRQRSDTYSCDLTQSVPEF